MNPVATNQFSLERYWAQGDAIGHAVACLLLAMSLLSWFCILAKMLSAYRVRRAAPALKAFWAAPDFDDALALLKLADREGVYLALPAAGAALAANASTLAGSMERGEQLVRALRDAIAASTLRIESGLTLLASIGATAPFVGLLGTVWGIYHALSTVSAAGIVQIDKVAGPVGEALIMTAFGLTVAIPAVLAYNGFNRLNRLTMAELDGFAHDLQAYFNK
ncbi:MAG: MotA/TolQ/ExbB proton channel family protein [Pseudomonadota bacterium]